MTLPDGTDAAAMDSFMLSEEESDLFEAIVWDKEVNGEPEDMATSMFEQFGDEGFSLGTGFLCGCNYTGHHQSKGSLYCPLLGEHFIQPRPGLGSYLRHSRKGFPSDRDKRSEQGIGPNRDPPEQVSLKNQAPKFEDSYIRAYLMIPDTDYNLNPEGYRPQWNAMKNTINRLVPTLATGDRWREVKYTPLRNRDPQLESTALGRVLFKYDPDHNGRRKATLWFEREATPYHDDEW
ncbi:hypothetical protein EIK77_007896 [Talaromyces pinophilus]|nr:hypothetical protein EIK77_007896 [Talaromyces pinophilus]